MAELAKTKSNDARSAKADFLRKFGRNEDGSIIIMTLLFFVTMLIMGGMAVDFMRFESRRTMLQNTADVAVLAAAELDQDKDPKAVVIDYFEKAGFGDTIIGEPDVLKINGYTSVGVEAKFEMNTHFLKFAGIKTLAAPARATAVEGIADIEVSLVVDISGSMREPVVPRNGGSSSQSKIEALRDAAKLFASSLLTPTKYRNKISLSLVPYTDQVNAGPDLFTAVGAPAIHNYSHCVDFPDSAFGTLAMPASASLSHVAHFQSNPARRYGSWDQTYHVVDSPICPQQTFERIIPLSQDYSTLETAINLLEPRGSTSIFLGLKWGTALLDPSMRPAITSLTGAGKPIDAVFSGRPADYPVEGVASGTQKVILVMTDGKNDYSYRPPAYAYDSPAEIAYFANNNFRYGMYTSYYGLFGYYNYHWLKTQWDYYGNVTYTDLIQAYSPATGDALFRDLCELAKEEGIIIYAVAVEAPTAGQQSLAACASSPSHFFDVGGDELSTVFQAIAKQITELRLKL